MSVFIIYLDQFTFFFFPGKVITDKCTIRPSSFGNVSGGCTSGGRGRGRGRGSAGGRCGPKLFYFDIADSEKILSIFNEEDFEKEN